MQLSADQISDEIHLSRNISKLLSWNCAGKSYLRTSRIVSGRGLFVSLRRYAWSFQLDSALLLAFSFQFSWITSTKTVRKRVSLLSSIVPVMNFTTQLVLYQLGISMCLRISRYILFVMIIISVDSACVTNWKAVMQYIRNCQSWVVDSCSARGRIPGLMTRINYYVYRDFTQCLAAQETN